MSIRSMLRVKEIILDYCYGSKELENFLHDICRNECDLENCDLNNCLVPSIIAKLQSTRDDLTKLFSKLDDLQKFFIVVK
jgi:hypothetical protein